MYRYSVNTIFEIPLHRYEKDWQTQAKVMEELRDMLLEKETVQGDEVVKLVKKFKGEPVDEPVAAEPVAA